MSIDGDLLAPKRRGPFGRLYHGETNIDFIGRTKLWFAGSIVLLLVGLVRGEVGRFHPGAVTFSSGLAVVYLIVMGSLAGFTAYAWLLRVARTSLVSTYAYVNPVVAVFLGWLILSEAITTRTLLAGAIIVIGVALIVTARTVGVSDPAGSPADVPPPHGRGN